MHCTLTDTHTHMSVDEKCLEMFFKWCPNGIPCQDSSGSQKSTIINTVQRRAPQ